MVANAPEPSQFVAGFRLAVQSSQADNSPLALAAGQGHEKVVAFLQGSLLGRAGLLLRNLNTGYQNMDI